MTLVRRLRLLWWLWQRELGTDRRPARPTGVYPLRSGWRAPESEKPRCR